VALPSGTRVGVYEILAKLGEGGMGEVYRGRDTRLARAVALKVLPLAFARDPDRLSRFEREAKLLASLNHQHIAQIYGFEDDGVARALVMELVDGPTLADRIAQGPLPVEETVSIARQIAAALESAHDQGIIHRDLKPANIKLRADGTVKVLDFGLAKLADAAPGSSHASALTSPAMTQAGIVLGTPAYMSPEQARGQAVDSRADLWAFGCVCFEMLTGRRTFDGETASDAISAILTREPAWDSLPDRTPAPLRRLLRRCLARDTGRRIRHAGDVRLELEEIGSGPGDATSSPDRRTRTSSLPWAVAAAASIVAIALAWRPWAAADVTSTHQLPTTRLELMLPPGLELFPSTSATVVAAPDGRSIAFVGTSGGSRQLFVRRLDAFDAAPVRGTLGATMSTFSRDGQTLAFVTAGGELRIASLADGLVTTVAKDASVLYGVAWTSDDQIIFTRDGALWGVSRSTGSEKQLTSRASNEQIHAWPSVLPDGRAVLFTVETATGPRIEAVTIANSERHLVLDQARMARLGPEGRLFYYRDERLLAAAFDQMALRVTGSPVPVGDNMPMLGGGTPVGDVSPGLMVFPPGAPQRRLVWVSREGAEEPVTDTPNAYMNPRLSPDGTRILVQAGAIWVLDLKRNTLERVSTMQTPTNAFPIWLPDGRTVMHRSGVGVRVQSTDGGAAGRTLPGTTEFDYPSAVTSDGKTLLLQRSSPTTSFDVMMAPLEDPSRPTAVVQGPAYEAGARLSPDENWLVYVSNESGPNEVYVRPFGREGRRQQVSSDGGSQPAWNPNGREIFYRIGDRMMAVTFTPAGSVPQLSAPKQLFARAYAYGAGITISNYDVSKDGQRFLMVKDDSTVGRLRVILNWRADTPATSAR
jgi:serine/threonine protein kinase/Tol biopolymer transport system component